MSKEKLQKFAVTEEGKAKTEIKPTAFASTFEFTINFVYIK